MEKAPRQDVLSILAPAVATASTDNTTVFRAPYAGVIAGVTYVADTAITGANTNTRKLSVINKGLAGSGTTVAASLQFDSGVNAAAFDEKTITLSGTAADLVLAEGDIVVLKSEAVGTGLADPGGTVFVTISRS